MQYTTSPKIYIKNLSFTNSLIRMIQDKIKCTKPYVKVRSGRVIYSERIGFYNMA